LRIRDPDLVFGAFFALLITMMAWSFGYEYLCGGQVSSSRCIASVADPGSGIPVLRIRIWVSVMFSFEG
jgi:hypothetical protein